MMLKRQIKKKILNVVSYFEGDTIIINGDVQSEEKLISTNSFASETNNPSENVDNNECYPGVLIVTSNYIRAGLGSSLA